MCVYIYISLVIRFFQGKIKILSLKGAYHECFNLLNDRKF